MYWSQKYSIFYLFMFLHFAKKNISQRTLENRVLLMDSGVSKIILVIISSLTLLNAAGNTWQYSM